MKTVLKTATEKLQTILTVKPSRIGTRLFYLGSVFSNLLYSSKTGVFYHLVLLLLILFLLHNTLSDKIIPPLFIRGTIKESNSRNFLLSASMKTKIEFLFKVE